MMAIAVEGLPEIVAFLIVCIILWGCYVRYKKALIKLFASFFTLLVLFMFFFYRDPYRIINYSPELILSPAEGKILKVVSEGSTEKRRVSIFLSPLDVHINRCPVSGVVENVRHISGGHIPADDEFASKKNEMNVITIRNENGVVVVQQVVGFLARRLVCNISEGDTVSAGQRFGLMKFGSRMDLFLPEDVKILVKVGEKVRAGQSIIGVWVED